MSIDEEALSRLAKNVRLFAGIDRPAIIEMLRKSERVLLQEGALVFEQGESGSSLYVLISGRVQVERQEGGRRVPLLTLQPGDTFGEMACVGDRVRSASIRALEPGMALRIEKSDLEGVPAAASHIYRNIARILALRLKTSTEALVRERLERETDAPEAATSVQETPPPQVAVIHRG